MARDVRRGKNANSRLFGEISLRDFPRGRVSAIEFDLKGHGRVARPSGGADYCLQVEGIPLKLNKKLRVNVEYSSRAALSRLSPFEAIRGADFTLERVRADSGGFHLTSITLEP